MTQRNVLRMGNPALLETSRVVEDFRRPELSALITDLWDTMNEEGGIGIAAPQIGVFERVVVFGLEADEDTPDSLPVPRTVLINPEIEPLDDDMCDGWEGCLSVPGLRGLVPRYRRIRYRGFDADGGRIEREAEDYHARVVQHECDHLDGVLYPQRVRDIRNFGFVEEIVLASRFGGQPPPSLPD